MEITNAHEKIEYLPEYLYRGQFARNDELNHRVLERNVPDKPLPPNFTPRTVLSKYALFPMLDSCMPATVPIEPNYDYSLTNNFTPPLMKVGPVSGFINNVSTETELRNQTYALHKGNENAIYVPSSNSDLYKVYIPSAPSDQPHPGLFQEKSFSQNPHPNLEKGNIGQDRFHNNTRVQGRTMIQKK